MHSWGYLRDRCRYLGRNINNELSRLVLENDKTSEYSQETANHEIKIHGRIVLDVWRLLRHEVKYYLVKIVLYLY